MTLKRRERFEAWMHSDANSGGYTEEAFNAGWDAALHHDRLASLNALLVEALERFMDDYKHEPETIRASSGAEIVRCRECIDDWPCSNEFAREAMARVREGGA